MRPRRLACRLGVGLLLLALAALPAWARQKARMLFEADSLYHHVMVLEAEDGLRYLSFNRAMGHQSAVLPGHPEVLTFAYTKSTFAALAFMEAPPQDVLFVGLGGGSLPMYLRRVLPQARVDIAEIDPMVVQVASQYLGFVPDAAMQVSVADGRQYLRRHDKLYDLIVLDAYNDQAVPFHLTTREFLELVVSRLKPGGVVASNIWSLGLNRYFPAQVATYQAVFPQLYLFQAGGGANYIFIATKDSRPVDLDLASRRAQALMASGAWSFDLPLLVRQEYTCYTDRPSQAKVLTDDFAPVNLLKALDDAPLLEHPRPGDAGERP